MINKSNGATNAAPFNTDNKTIACPDKNTKSFDGIILLSSQFPKYISQTKFTEFLCSLLRKNTTTTTSKIITINGRKRHDRSKKEVRN